MGACFSSKRSTSGSPSAHKPKLETSKNPPKSSYRELFPQLPQVKLPTASGRQNFAPMP